MIDFESRLSKMEADVAAMKEKVSFFSVIYEKFDRTLDKLDERQLEDRKEINEMMVKLQDNIIYSATFFIKLNMIKLKSNRVLIKTIYLVLIFSLCLSSCRTHRDCKGRKKTAKTNMGGWI